MNNSTSTLSIIIVNWNTCDMLAACLTSVAQNMATLSDIDVETIVVDNASTDSSVAMVKESFPWVKLIGNQHNAGFAQANNQAIAQARGSFILLLNSDTAVHQPALQIMLDFMHQTPQAGAVGAQLLNEDGTLQQSCQPMLTPEREFWRLILLDKVWPKATYPMQKLNQEGPRRVEVIKGACLLLRREALDEVGVLDDRYFMYTEEVDLCYRLLQAGWQLWYLPAARITHFGESSSRQIAETMYVQLYRSKVQFYRKMGGSWRAQRFKTVVAATYLPRLLVASWRARRTSTWQPRARTYRRLLGELRHM